MSLSDDDVKKLIDLTLADMPDGLKKQVKAHKEYNTATQKLYERVYKMKRFRVLHYRSAIDGNMVDNAIGFWTKVMNLWDIRTWRLPAYSHTEIWVPDGHGRFSTSYTCHPITYCGTCYTSTMGQIRTEGAQVEGTRRLLASVVLKHPECWDYTEFEVPDDVFANGMRCMAYRVLMNKGYAKRDISKFFPIVRHLVKQDPLRDICSEFAQNLCVVFRVLAGPFKVISPLRLARKMPWIRNLKTGKLVKGK